jgi:hypothetical protein
MDIILKMIEEEFDYTLTDPYFKNKETNTLTGTIYKGLQQRKQELCISIFDQVSEFIRELPFPLTPDQTEAMSVLRQGIRTLTYKDELIFRNMSLAAARILNRVNIPNESGN